MARNECGKRACRNCKHSRKNLRADGMCDACSERAARPDRGPGGRLLAPAVGKVCWGCGNRFATTRPERTRCLACEREGVPECTHADRKDGVISAALVAWHAVLQALGLPCESDPAGQVRWVAEWRLAFPDSGAAADDTARRHILATLDSVGRLDLLQPARRRSH